MNTLLSYADMVEQADTTDLKPVGSCRVGSTPTISTKRFELFLAILQGCE